MKPFNATRGMVMFKKEAANTAAEALNDEQLGLISAAGNSGFTTILHADLFGAAGSSGYATVLHNPVCGPFAR
jgi:hypothetical protein